MCWFNIKDTFLFIFFVIQAFLYLVFISLLFTDPISYSYALFQKCEMWWKDYLMHKNNPTKRNLKMSNSNNNHTLGGGGWCWQWRTQFGKQTIQTNKAFQNKFVNTFLCNNLFPKRLSVTDGKWHCWWQKDGGLTHRRRTFCKPSVVQPHMFNYVWQLKIETTFFIFGLSYISRNMSGFHFTWLRH